MLARVLGAVFCTLLLTVGAANASPDPYRDQAEKIRCPPAPSGWMNPTESAGSRFILTPLTAVEQTDDPTVIVGAPVVQVDCHYRTTSGKDLQVSVRYALPVDINPWNDFYIGCTVTGHPQAVSTGAYAWNEHDRIYRVIGQKTWSLATFIDSLNQLEKGEVPRFEAITRTMLDAAQPFAHDCKLAGNGGPVDLKSIWTFSFDVKASKAGVTSSGKTSGSFVTASDQAGGSIGSIKDLFATNFRVKVTSKGKTNWIAIHVGNAIQFRHGYGSLLRTHVMVIASTDAGCRKGSTGTMLLSVQSLSAPRVALQVCGHTFLDGKGRVRAQIQTV